MRSLDGARCGPPGGRARSDVVARSRLRRRRPASLVHRAGRRRTRSIEPRRRRSRRPSPRRLRRSARRRGPTRAAAAPRAATTAALDTESTPWPEREAPPAANKRPALRPNTALPAQIALRREQLGPRVNAALGAAMDARAGAPLGSGAARAPAARHTSVAALAAEADPARRASAALPDRPGSGANPAPAAAARRSSAAVSPPSIAATIPRPCAAAARRSLPAARCGGHLLVGDAYYRLERFPDALREYQAALALDPGNASIKRRRDLAEQPRRHNTPRRAGCHGALVAGSWSARMKRRSPIGPLSLAALDRAGRGLPEHAHRRRLAAGACSGRQLGTRRRHADVHLALRQHLPRLLRRPEPALPQPGHEPRRQLRQPRCCLRVGAALRGAGRRLRPGPLFLISAGVMPPINPQVPSPLQAGLAAWRRRRRAGARG